MYPLKMLLLSSSRVYGRDFLDHAEQEIRSLLGPDPTTILFIPYAKVDHQGYARLMKKRFKKIGYELNSIHHETHPSRAVSAAQAVFVGGGNTFLLLRELYRYNLVDLLRTRVREGMPYMGSSAGSNVVCQNIKTTNDMPIVYPPSFRALDIVPFNINPHYFDPDPSTKQMGETRETRIREFHEHNDTTVIGLREGAMLRIVGNSILLVGEGGARLFRKSQPPRELDTGSPLDFLLVEHLVS